VIRVSLDSLGLRWLHHDKLKHIGHFLLTQLEVRAVDQVERSHVAIPSRQSVPSQLRPMGIRQETHHQALC